MTDNTENIPISEEGPLEENVSSPESSMAPMAHDGIHAGFPSPAQDYMKGFIDLNKELVRHPEATFYGRVVGDSMIDAGVEQGDILVIDKSLEPSEGSLAVCFLDGEFALKYISYKDPGKTNSVAAKKQPRSYNILHQDGLWLLPANEEYPPIHVTEGNDFTVWGIVTYIIKKAPKMQGNPSQSNQD